jgi:hypothetical protein
MSFERYNNGGNNKFPLTNYGTSQVQDLAQYGAALGTDTQDVKKLEVILKGGKVVQSSEYDSSIVSVLRKGVKVESVTVDATETFDAVINVGIANKADGTGVAAAALYTGTPTVGTSEDGILLAPLDEVVLADKFVVISTTSTVGTAKAVITYRDAIPDIE